jgi:hypothetical protein
MGEYGLSELWVMRESTVMCQDCQRVLNHVNVISAVIHSTLFSAMRLCILKVYGLLSEHRHRQFDSNARSTVVIARTSPCVDWILGSRINTVCKDCLRFNSHVRRSQMKLE